MNLRKPYGNEVWKSFVVIVPEKNPHGLGYNRRMIIRPCDKTVEELTVKGGFVGHTSLYGCCLDSEDNETYEHFMIRAAMNGINPEMIINEDEDFNVTSWRVIETGKEVMKVKKKKIR